MASYISNELGEIESHLRELVEASKQKPKQCDKRNRLITLSSDKLLEIINPFHLPNHILIPPASVAYVTAPQVVIYEGDIVRRLYVDLVLNSGLTVSVLCDIKYAHPYKLAKDDRESDYTKGRRKYPDEIRRDMGQFTKVRETYTEELHKATHAIQSYFNLLVTHILY